MYYIFLNIISKTGQRQPFLATIETQLDFEELVKNDGLIVLDVYSEWCGPCFAMIKYTREVFMDYLLTKPTQQTVNLHIGLCKVDHIEQLSEFANNSEPTWIFLKVLTYILAISEILNNIIFRIKRF